MQIGLVRCWVQLKQMEVVASITYEIWNASNQLVLQNKIIPVGAVLLNARTALMVYQTQQTELITHPLPSNPSKNSKSQSYHRDGYRGYCRSSEYWGGVAQQCTRFLGFF
jgi:hypothetical protein